MVLTLHPPKFLLIIISLSIFSASAFSQGAELLNEMLRESLKESMKESMKEYLKGSMREEQKSDSMIKPYYQNKNYEIPLDSLFNYNPQFSYYMFTKKMLRDYEALKKMNALEDRKWIIDPNFYREPTHSYYSEAAAEPGGYMFINPALSPGGGSFLSVTGTIGFLMNLAFPMAKTDPISKIRKMEVVRDTPRDTTTTRVSNEDEEMKKEATEYHFNQYLLK